MTGWLIVRWASDGEALYWCGMRGISNSWSTNKDDAVWFMREIDATNTARGLPSPSGLARRYTMNTSAKETL